MRRSQGDQRHDTEGIGDDVAAHRAACAHGQRQQESGCHRAAGDAAGVKRDAHKHRRDKAAHDKRRRVAGG